jgi:hypothetical protein
MIVHTHYPIGEPRAEGETLAAVEAGFAANVICLVEALSCNAS